MKIKSDAPSPNVGIKEIKVLAVSYLFPHSLQPSYGIFVLNRLKALANYADIQVINPIPWFPGANKISRYRDLNSVPFEEEIGGLKVYHPRYFSVPGILKWVEAFSYQRAVLDVVTSKKLKFDLIDLHWTYPDLPAGCFLKKTHSKPMVCTLRGMEAFYSDDGRLRSSFIKKGLRFSDQVVALSQELKQKCDLITGDPAKSVVIPNGVDTETFHYVPRDEARLKLGLPIQSESKIILGVGSLIRRKGFHLVLDAMPSLLKVHPGLQYHIVGAAGPEGDYRKKLKQIVVEKGLEESVVFQGAAPNSALKYWYNAADIFCLSSLGEGSPNVLSEALACGCPAVSTAVGSAPDIMNMAGLDNQVVPLDSLERLKDKLESALSVQQDRQHQSKQYHQYNWDWCAKKVIKVYRQACE